MPIEEKCPPVRVGVWLKFRVSFRVGGQSDNCPRENRPVIRLRVRVRISFGVGGRGIFLEGNCPRTESKYRREINHSLTENLFLVLPIIRYFL